MKKLLFIILFLPVSSFCQIEVINTGVTSNIQGFTKIGNTIIVRGWNNFAIRSDNFFDTYTTIPLPTNPTWSNRIKYVGNKLYIQSTTPSNSSTQLYVSNDTGLTWNMLIDTTFFLARDFTFFDSLNGIIIGGFYKQLITTDGGINWVLQPSVFNFVTDLKSNFDSIAVVTLFQYCSYSKDKGQTWLNNGIGNNANPMDLQIVSKDTFYISGTDPTGQDYLAYSFDGNTTLTTEYNIQSIDKTLKGISVISANEIYLVGEDFPSNLLNGTIFETNDTGKTYKIYHTNINSSFNSILFLNDSIALISGTNGILLKWNKNSFATEIYNINKLNSEFTIYPNPTIHTQTISFRNLNQYEHLKIRLIDSKGKVVKNVYDAKVQLPNFSIDINLGGLPSGIYFYQIQIGNTNYLEKVSKE